MSHLHERVGSTCWLVCVFDTEYTVLYPFRPLSCPYTDAVEFKKLKVNMSFLFHFKLLWVRIMLVKMLLVCAHCVLVECYAFVVFLRSCTQSHKWFHVCIV